jgi:hypothetical protein
VEINPQASITASTRVMDVVDFSNEPRAARNPGYAKVKDRVTWTRIVEMNASLVDCSNV